MCSEGVAAVSCFYKWISRVDNVDRVHTDTDRRRALLDVAVAEAFRKPGVCMGRRGWSQIFGKLEWGWRRRRWPIRRDGLTRQDKTAPKFPDLVKRDFLRLSRTGNGSGI